VASYSALPEPMLARSGPLPTSGDYAYEVKWDGFRAIVSTEGPLRVRSRRGWDMTEHVGFLAQLPVRAVLDGELVSLDDQGKPDFPQLCESVLMRRMSAPLTFMAFDVLSLDGRTVAKLAYSERRAILDDLNLNGRLWRTPESFDDGGALWAAVCEHELEGVVAKRRSGRYVSGERGWIKTKNRDYRRYELERESAFKAKRPRQFGGRTCACDGFADVTTSSGGIVATWVADETLGRDTWVWAFDADEAAT
jgi:bifunctional non-homologous end joining protein LigD